MSVTDEERAKLRAISKAADDLDRAACRLSCGEGSPADIEAAWQRLLALRWNYNMDDAPKGVRLWGLWAKGTTAVFVRGEVMPAGGPTAWMPLPPVKD